MSWCEFSEPVVFEITKCEQSRSVLIVKFQLAVTGMVPQKSHSNQSQAIMLSWGGLKSE